MSFLFPLTAWAGLLIGVPLLIHLINLRRHKHVQWAAMDFLLQSQRRNKKWIFLKQMLLLLLRTMIIAGALLLFMQPILKSTWGNWLGTEKTHHIILLDDSYSMADSWKETSAYKEAKRVALAILHKANQAGGTQQVTLLRYSEAIQLSATSQPAYFQQKLDASFLDQLEETLTSFTPSHLTVGPAQAMQAVLRLPKEGAGETSIVYWITDFRKHEFSQNNPIKKQLQELQKRASQVHFVQCVETSHENLTLTSLAPKDGLRAAGVDTYMQLTVKNNSLKPSPPVTVNLVLDGAPIPTVELPKIAAGKEYTHQFLINFKGTGAHTLVAGLKPDALALDNTRYFACNLTAGMPVLIIDSSQDQRDSFFLSTALAPGGVTTTGWLPRIEAADYLRRGEDLSRYAAICLLDVPRLDAEAQLALEKYTEQGGGIAFFMGSAAQRTYYNTALYKDGQGLFPVPLALPVLLRDQREKSSPDVVVTDHPIFRVLTGKRNQLLDLLLINFYYGIEKNWDLSKATDTKVLAQLRNGQPLVLEKRFGKGTVLTHLTKLSPTETSLGRWGNWSMTRAFPIMANELVGYLSSNRKQDSLLTVGQELTLKFSEELYEPEVEFQISKDGEAALLTMTAKPTAGMYQVSAGEVEAIGFTEARLTPRKGQQETRKIAFNLTSNEGDLTLVDQAELAQHLEGINYTMHYASDFSLGERELSGYRLSDLFLYGLLLMLLGEQVLAFYASYHSPLKPILPTSGGHK